MNLILNQENNSMKSMYNSYTEWNSEVSNIENIDGYDDVYNPGLGSIFTTNQFHELTLPIKGTEEDIWMLPEIEENTIHSTQRLFGNLMPTQVGNDPEYASIPNCWGMNSNKEYIPMSQAHLNTKFANNSNNANSLIVDDSLSAYSIYGGSISDNSSVSHTSTLNGVWVVPDTDKNIQLQLEKSKIEGLSSDESSSIETSYSERRRRIHFSRQKSDLAYRTKIRMNNLKYKNTELSMLVASGGAPLGKLDEIGGVEWYPERQSWKVVGHTGISWCVRRKTWRVWFITSNGTRATRSFNPKEHGTVAAALKAAIEFLEHKRAEKSPIQKNLRSRLKRNNLYTNCFSSNNYSKSNSSISSNQKFKAVDNLIN